MGVPPAPGEPGGPVLLAVDGGERCCSQEAPTAAAQEAREEPRGTDCDGGAGEAPPLQELGGIILGDTVRDRVRQRLGLVRALRLPDVAAVEFPAQGEADESDDESTVEVPIERLAVAARGHLRVGQRLAWRGADEDVPRGAIGVLCGFKDDGSVMVRFGDRRFGFAAKELLEAGSRDELLAGDQVRWRSADEDVPEGTLGVVMGFKLDSATVLVDFGGHVFGFSPSQLELVEKRVPRSDDPPLELEVRRVSAPLLRPPCYPFDGDTLVEFGGGRTIRAAMRDGERMATGLVVFCPGTHGGVGPCRVPGSKHDRNALFPTLAESLQADGVFTCRVCWSAMHPPLEEAIQGTVTAALLALGRMQGMQTQRPGKVGVCLVGHSLGGAVALNAAALLARLLPEMNRQGCGLKQGQELVGVCTLAAQEFGSIKAVQGLGGGVRKLFLHGSDDDVLPAATVERIHAAAAEPKEFCVLPGGEHDFYAFRAHLLGSVKEFLLDALLRRPPSKGRRRAGSDGQLIWRAKVRR